MAIVEPRTTPGVTGPGVHELAPHWGMLLALGIVDGREGHCRGALRALAGRGFARGRLAGQGRARHAFALAARSLPCRSRFFAWLAGSAGQLTAAAPPAPPASSAPARCRKPRSSSQRRMTRRASGRISCPISNSR